MKRYFLLSLAAICALAACTAPTQSQQAPRSSPKLGAANIDVKWSNYGGYLQRTLDSIQLHWTQILIEMKVTPPSGSTVSVKFILTAEGKIPRIVEVQSQSTSQGELACLNALTAAVPYDKWSDEMKAVLGSQQELTLTFHYP